MSPRAKRRLLPLAMAVALGLVALLVWPTFWTYGVERQGLKRGGFVDVPIRHHRITGRKQSRTEGAWHDGPVHDGSVLCD